MIIADPVGFVLAVLTPHAAIDMSRKYITVDLSGEGQEIFAILRKTKVPLPPPAQKDLTDKKEARTDKTMEAWLPQDFARTSPFQNQQVYYLC